MTRLRPQMYKDQRHSFKPLEDWIKCKMNPSSKLIENYKGKWALFQSQKTFFFFFIIIFLSVLENIKVWGVKFWHLPKTETIPNISAYRKIMFYRKERSMISQDIFYLRKGGSNLAFKSFQKNGFMQHIKEKFYI